MGRILPTGLIWGLLLGCLAFFGLTVFGDLPRVMEALAHFPPPSVAAVLLLALLNYSLRFARWDLYLRHLGIVLPPMESATVFLSGLAFSVSPGKAGELVKSYMLRRSRGVPMNVSAPVVVMERIADLFGVLVLALLGGASLGYRWQTLAAGAVLLVAGLGFVMSPGVVALLGRIAPRRLQGLAASQEHLRALTAPRLAAIGLVLSVGAWFAECVGFWLVMWGLGSAVPVLSASFVYAFGTLVGALSLLPGGLVTTEGSMVAALAFLRVEPSASATGTLLIRLGTLWFAVALGAVALVRWNRTQAQAQMADLPKGGGRTEHPEGPEGAVGSSGHGGSTG